MHTSCVAATYSDPADTGEDGCSIAKALETHECFCKEHSTTYKVYGFNPETKQLSVTFDSLTGWSCNSCFIWQGQG